MIKGQCRCALLRCDPNWNKFNQVPLFDFQWKFVRKRRIEHCCNYSNTPNTFVGLLEESSSASFFTAVSIVLDNDDSSGNDFETILVNSRRLKSVCSSKIVSATLIQSNATSDRSRTISSAMIAGSTHARMSLFVSIRVPGDFNNSSKKSSLRLYVWWPSKCSFTLSV